MKLILDKIDGIEMDGEGIYAVYKTNYIDRGEGDIEIKRNVKDVGLKDEMMTKYPLAVNLEEVAKEVLKLK